MDLPTLNHCSQPYRVPLPTGSESGRRGAHLWSPQTARAGPSFQFQCSSPGLMAEDGPWRPSRPLAMEPTHPAPPSRYLRSPLAGRRAGAGMEEDISLVFPRGQLCSSQTPSFCQSAASWAMWRSLRGPSFNRRSAEYGMYRYPQPVGSRPSWRGSWGYQENRQRRLPGGGGIRAGVLRRQAGAYYCLMTSRQPGS